MVKNQRVSPFHAAEAMTDLKQHIRSVPDFPKPGILFYDIGTLLADGPAWHETLTRLADILRPLKPDALIGIESRGFLVAAPLAAMLGVGFVMVRKKGKLPGKTIRHSYALEYGTDTIEIQEGMLKPKQRVIICDDLLATGGTAAAATALTRQIGAEVIHAAFIIDLTFLEGRKRLDVPATSLVSYES
jgi:adenine phosphoribosyltransferase